MALEIASEAFVNGGTIPEECSYTRQNWSPPFRWSGQPKGTRSLVLWVDDPDAPGGSWVHWVLFNMPGHSSGLEEAASNNKTLPKGSLEGKNDFGGTGYGGPCPPPGLAHRYYFTLFALDAELSLPGGVGKKEVERAMEGHVLAKAEVMGLFGS